MQAGVESLGVDPPRRHVLGQERDPGHAPWAPCIPSRPSTVGATSSSSTGRRRGAAGLLSLGQLDQQRHVDGLVVKENAVLVFAMIAQALAVVREEDDERLVIDVQTLQLGDQLAHDLVRRGDLAVVLGAGTSTRTARAARRACGARRCGRRRRTACPSPTPATAGRASESRRPAAGGRPGRWPSAELDAVLVEVEARRRARSFPGARRPRRRRPWHSPAFFRISGR